mgnify:CR=1 FL=1
MSNGKKWKLLVNTLVNALMEDDGLIVFVEEKVENVDFNISDTKNGLKLLKEKYQ